MSRAAHLVGSSGSKLTAWLAVATCVLPLNLAQLQAACTAETPLNSFLNVLGSPSVVGRYGNSSFLNLGLVCPRLRPGLVSQHSVYLPSDWQTIEQEAARPIAGVTTLFS